MTDSCTRTVGTAVGMNLLQLGVLYANARPVRVIVGRCMCVMLSAAVCCPGQLWAWYRINAVSVCLYVCLYLHQVSRCPLGFIPLLVPGENLWEISGTNLLWGRMPFPVPQPTVLGLN